MATEADARLIPAHLGLTDRATGVVRFRRAPGADSVVLMGGTVGEMEMGKALKRKARPVARKAAKPTNEPPRKRRPRVNHQQRRLEFMRSAAESIIELGPDVSMGELAKRAGVQKPVFYRVFSSRAAVLDAIFSHVHEAALLVYQMPWEGYGHRMAQLLAQAREEPAVFIAALRVLRNLPEARLWRRRIVDVLLTGTLHSYAAAPSAPPGAERRAIHAARSLNTLMVDTLMVWLGDEDGLSDEARILWWANLMREWQRITRIVYELEGPLSVTRKQLSEAGVRD